MGAQPQISEDVSAMDLLEAEIRDLLKFLEPTETEVMMRKVAINNLTDVIKQHLPDAQVVLFGSFDTGLFLPNSDIDLVVHYPPILSDTSAVALSEDALSSSTTTTAVDTVSRSRLTGGRSDMELLGDIANALEKSNAVTDLRFLRGARVPIIKCRERTTQFDFDISLNQVDGEEGAIYTKEVLNQYPLLRPLLVLLKFHLTSRNLNETYNGGLGSFALLLLALRYHQWVSLESQPITVGALLIGFLHFYGKRFNYTQHAVTVRNGGGFVPKHPSQIDPTRPFLLNLENPLKPDVDVGRGVYNIAVIQHAFQQAETLISARLSKLKHTYHQRLNEQGGLAENFLMFKIYLDQSSQARGLNHFNTDGFNYNRYDHGRGSTINTNHNTALDVHWASSAATANTDSLTIQTDDASIQSLLGDFAQQLLTPPQEVHLHFPQLYLLVPLVSASTKLLQFRARLESTAAALRSKPTSPIKSPSTIVSFSNALSPDMKANRHRLASFMHDKVGSPTNGATTSLLSLALSPPEASTKKRSSDHLHYRERSLQASQLITPPLDPFVDPSQQQQRAHRSPLIAVHTVDPASAAASSQPSSVSSSRAQTRLSFPPAVLDAAARVDESPVFESSPEYLDDEREESNETWSPIATTEHNGTSSSSSSSNGTHLGPSSRTPPMQIPHAASPSPSTLTSNGATTTAAAYSQDSKRNRNRTNSGHHHMNHHHSSSFPKRTRGAHS